MYPPARPRVGRHPALRIRLELILAWALYFDISRCGVRGVLVTVSCACVCDVALCVTVSEIDVCVCVSSVNPLSIVIVCVNLNM